MTGRNTRSARRPRWSPASPGCAAGCTGRVGGPGWWRSTRSSRRAVSRSSSSRTSNPRGAGCRRRSGSWTSSGSSPDRTNISPIGCGPGRACRPRCRRRRRRRTLPRAGSRCRVHLFPLVRHLEWAARGMQALVVKGPPLQDLAAPQDPRPQGPCPPDLAAPCRADPRLRVPPRPTRHPVDLVVPHAPDRCRLHQVGHRRLPAQADPAQSHPAAVARSPAACPDQATRPWETGHPNQASRHRTAPASPDARQAPLVRNQPADPSPRVAPPGK